VVLFGEVCAFGFDLEKVDDSVGEVGCGFGPVIGGEGSDCSGHGFGNVLGDATVGFSGVELGPNVDELVGEPRGEGLGDEFVGDSVREGHGMGVWQATGSGVVPR
jgi:hypothetical protein